MLAKLRERVALARQIDNAAHNVQKANHEKNWLRETADALGIDLSDDDNEVDEDGASRRKKCVQYSVLLFLILLITTFPIER